MSFMKSGGQTSKNVHDVQKVCLEKNLCVLSCFVEFYEFVFDEINIGVPKLLYNLGYKHSGNIPRTIQESLRKDPCWWPKLPKAVPHTDENNGQWPGRRPVGGGSRWVLSIGRLRSHFQGSLPNTGQTGRSICGQTVHLWPSR